MRAPITGIVLITEMTASFTLPLLAACFAAMIVPTLLHTAPIYDALREPGVRRQNSQGLNQTAKDSYTS